MLFLLLSGAIFGACSSDKDRVSVFVKNVVMPPDSWVFAPGDGVTVSAEGFEADDEIMLEIHWQESAGGGSFRRVIFFSSMMTGFFGLMVVTILNRNKHVTMDLSPFFLCLFAFCFSVTLGSLWEIYEFTADGLFGLNMQKFMTAQGELLVGHEALRDTMKDIIVLQRHSYWQ